MGVLTEATLRLQEEIAAMRRVRVALRSDLVRQTGALRSLVSALCAGFASDRAGAHRVWFHPRRFEDQPAERHPQRMPAEEARAKAPAAKRPAAAAHAKPRRHAPVAALRSRPKPRSKRAGQH